MTATVFLSLAWPALILKAAEVPVTEPSATPIDVKAVFAHANSLMKDGQTALAKDEFLKVVEADPDNAAAFYSLGLISFRQNALESAIDYLRRSVLLNSKEPNSHYILAAALSKYGENEKAKEEYIKVTEIAPNFPAAHQDLGLLYFRLGEFDLAVDSLKEASRLMPNSPNTLLTLGMAYVRAGSPEKALDQVVELRNANQEVKARSLENYIRAAQKPAAPVNPLPPLPNAQIPPGSLQAQQNPGTGTTSVTGTAHIQGRGQSKSKNRNPFGGGR